MIYKGRVISIKEKYAMVLTDEMSYVKVLKKDKMYIGMNIIFIQNDIYKQSNMYRAALKYAAVILVIICSMIILYKVVPYKQNNIAVAIVSIDINPSIELEINNQNEIIKVIPINKDAIEISDQYLLNKDIKEGIFLLITRAQEKNYLTLDNNSILLSSVSLDEEYRFTLDDLTEGIKERLIIEEALGFIQVYAIHSQKEHMKLARESGLSIGKYEVYKTLEEYDELTLQEVKNMKVEQLFSRVRYRNGDESIEKDNESISNELMIRQEIMIQKRERYGNSDIDQDNSYNNPENEQGEGDTNRPENTGQHGNMNGAKDETNTSDPPAQEEIEENQQDNGEETTNRPEDKSEPQGSQTRNGYGGKNKKNNF